MSDPVPPILSMGTSRCWTAPRDPTSSETSPIEMCEFWYNTDSESLFMCCSSGGENGLIWQTISMSGK